MKGLYIALGAVFFVAMFGCSEETIEFKRPNGFAQLSGASSLSITENGSVGIEVILDKIYNSDITINFDVSSSDPSRYTLPNSLVIPAGESSGTVILQSVDNSDIDGDLDVTINLSESSDLPIGIGGDGMVGVSKTITIIDNEVICNDLVLKIVTDTFGDETKWTVTDLGGNVVASGGPYELISGGASYEESFTLPDGCYTFTIFDAFGDGQVSSGGNLLGSYSLECLTLTHASGGGDWGFSEATDFCVNQ